MMSATGVHLTYGRTRALRYAARGQALIMAVLVMFLLAGLGGLFVATLNQALVQTARTEDRMKLEQIVDAGLQQAQQELLASPDGADWRPDAGPDTANPGWMRHGDGFYRVQVSYGPAGDITPAAPMCANPLDRFLKVTVQARFTLQNRPNVPDDPATEAVYNTGYIDPRRFLERQVTAFMPLGLTDYLLWVTNKDGASDPTTLGDDVDLGVINTVDVDPMERVQDPAFPTDPTRTLLRYSDADLGALLASGATQMTATNFALYDGPIHVNGDLTIGSHLWLGMTRYKAGLANSFESKFSVRRNDMLTVTGALTTLQRGAAFASRLALQEDDSEPLSLYALNTAVSSTLVNPLAQNAAGTTRYLQTRTSNPLIRALKPPTIDRRDPVTGLHRYRSLTLESALADFRSSGNGAATAYSTRMLGWGEGLYLDDETTQVQHGGNLDALRREWLSPQDEATQGTVWIDGIYHPENAGAVEVTLHDWTLEASSAVATQLPYIELRRYDGGQFRDRADNPVGDHIVLPYPRNGVLYAEGNLIVKGNLPASLDFADADGDGRYEAVLDGSGRQRPGGWVAGAAPAPDTVRYYASAANRRYDLTIVSGGTVYIEGNLLGPVTRKAKYAIAQPQPSDPCWQAMTAVNAGNPYDSKLALLAHDNVCLNPTKLFASATRAAEESEDGSKAWRVRANDPLEFTVTTAGDITTSRMSLLLRHAGAADMGLDYSVVRMKVNGVDYHWTNPNAPVPPVVANPALAGRYDSRSLVFGTPDTRVPTVTSGVLDLRTPGWRPLVASVPPGDLVDQWGGGLYPTDPMEQQTWDLLDYRHYNQSALPAEFTANRFPLLGNGAGNTIRLEWAEGADYLVGTAPSPSNTESVLASGTDLQVDALVYAQRGSWFIIPGMYFNDPSNPDTSMRWPYPAPGEPLDVHIVFHGAIVENHHADAEAEEAWTRHWRGANLWYFDRDKNGVADVLEDPALGGWDRDAWRWTGRRLGIEYHYDATLLRPICYETDGTIRSYRPRLPKLPVCPNVFSIGVVQNQVK
jgi:hypothetical protein